VSVVDRVLEKLTPEAIDKLHDIVVNRKNRKKET